MIPTKKPKLELLSEEFIKKILEEAFVVLEKTGIFVENKEASDLFYGTGMKIDKKSFKNVIKHLVDLQFPHLAVVSGSDLGKTIELIYHFSLYFGTRHNEISLNISVELPKANPTIETICDHIPGALITEREKQEMLGVKIEGIPDSRRVFLPEEFPKGMYPWRKDETGPQKMVRN